MVTSYHKNKRNLFDKATRGERTQQHHEMNHKNVVRKRFLTEAIQETDETQSEQSEEPVEDEKMDEYLDEFSTGSGNDLGQIGSSGR